MKLEETPAWAKRARYHAPELELHERDLSRPWVMALLVLALASVLFTVVAAAYGVGQ